MLSVTIKPKARQDIKHFFHYISQDSEKSALNFLEHIQKTNAIISEFPLIAPILDTKNKKLSNTHWFPIKSFPNHFIFYTLNKKQIMIIRVLHKSQNIESIFKI